MSLSALIWRNTRGKRSSGPTQLLHRIHNTSRKFASSAPEKGGNSCNVTYGVENFVRLGKTKYSSPKLGPRILFHPYFLI